MAENENKQGVPADDFEKIAGEMIQNTSQPGGNDNGGDPPDANNRDDDSGGPGGGDNSRGPGVGDNNRQNIGEFKLADLGDFQSLDEVKQVIERGKNFTPEFESEIADLRQKSEKFGQVQKEVNELRQRNPFNNELYYKLDKLEKDDPDNADFLRKVVFGAGDDMDLIRHDLMQKHKDVFKDNENGLDRMIKKKYPNLFEDGVDPEDDAYQDDYMQMKMDANEIRKKVNETIDKIEVPKPEDPVEKQKAVAEAWKPNFTNIVKDLEKIPVEFDDGDGNNSVFLELEVSDKEKQLLARTAAQYILEQGLEYNEKNLKSVVSSMRNMYLASNLPKVVTAVADRASQSVDGKWRNAVHNSKRMDDKKRSPGSPQYKEPGEQVLEDLEKDGGFTGI